MQITTFTLLLHNDTSNRNVKGVVRNSVMFLFQWPRDIMWFAFIAAIPGPIVVRVPRFRWTVETITPLPPANAR
jgi:hypothetical protein